MFSKFHAAGNDFILVDDRKGDFFYLKTDLIREFCLRNTGIGADGFILLQRSETADFRMRIFNSDGLEAHMCGNGLRCLFAFIKYLNIKGDRFDIETKSGIYRCEKQGKLIKTFFPEPKDIRLHQNISIENEKCDFHLINTGVLHAVSFVRDIQDPYFLAKAQSVRFNSVFVDQGGVNVTFVQIKDDATLLIRTYEKGVEAETMACGTAAVGSSLLYYMLFKKNPPYKIIFSSLESVACDFSIDCQEIKNISLVGGAVHVFNGFFMKNVL